MLEASIIPTEPLGWFKLGMMIQARPKIAVQFSPRNVAAAITTATGSPVSCAKGTGFF